MKKIILSIIITCLLKTGFGQLKIGTGTQWIITGGASVVLGDLSLVNDGTIAAGSGSFKFTGTAYSTIGGNTAPSFYIIEIAKTNSAKVLLNRNINVSSSINFISGQLDLNGNNTVLSTGANIAGETETNRITGVNGGFVEVTQNLNSPNGNNPGNLGAFITSSANLGSVTVRRGHLSLNGTGLTSSINRYYRIIPVNNTDLNATLRLKYFDAELNGQNENSLVLYQGVNGSATWNSLSRTSNNTNSNYVEKTGLSNFSFQTLANDNSVAGAVTGLVFTGTRKKTTEVQLNWTTQTETNMSGYQIQRRLDIELNFSDRGFVNTLAPGGNSNIALNYQSVDVNAHNSVSYYRLKIIDQSNNVSFSPIIAVAGKSKGASGGNGNGNGNKSGPIDGGAAKVNTPADATANAKVTVGPNPNNGNFWFAVSGIEKETTAALLTIDGKVLKQFQVFNMQQEKINGLSTGVYLLKVQGLETVKVIVQ